MTRRWTRRSEAPARRRSPRSDATAGRAYPPSAAAAGVGAVLAVAAAVVLVPPPALTAQEADTARSVAEVSPGISRDEAEALLATSRIGRLLDTLDDLFLEHLRAAGVDSTAAQGSLDSVVAAAFADSLVYDDLVAFLTARKDGGLAARALARLHDGAARRLSELPEPGASIEEYVRTLERQGPPLARIRLVAQWVEVQKAGTFYVLLDQAARESVHRIATTVGATDDEFEPLSRGEFRRAYRRNMDLAVVSFLWRFQDVDEATLRAAMDAYRTEAGQWWVDEYTLAVAHAVRRAGDRVEARLRGSVADADARH